MADVAMEESLSPQHLKPITLPTWPSCSNCLAWSNELLAVAGGEVVHLIDLKTSPPRTETIRVNEFEAADVRVNLASIFEFSIGQEQSNSHVVALAWSSPGLGIHHRPVLAILTANHVLSLWEWTGKVGSWSRSYIINPSLTRNNGGLGSKAGRSIIAFSWLPPLQLGNSPNHFLVALDTEGNVWTLKVSKSDASNTGTWQLGPFHHQHVQPISSQQSPHTAIASLDSCGYDAVEPEQWKLMNDEEQTILMSRIRLLLRRRNFRPDPRGSASFMLTIELEDGQYAISGRDAAFVEPKPIEITPENFADSITDLTTQFDKDFSLQGHYSVRWMGFATSPDRSLAAACVTLHPSASLEYTQPREEQSTVLFIPTSATTQHSSIVRSKEDTELDLIKAVTRHATEDSIQTDTDIKVVRIAIAAIRAYYSDLAPLSSWSDLASSLVALFQSTEADYSTPTTPIEICEICRHANPPDSDNGTNSITFLDGLSSGICNSGHKSHRCGITFLAIQDPGISKYCTQCKRQFLCIEKLEDGSGPSVAKTLLEEHGLCPYCQGYFRD